MTEGKPVAVFIQGEYGIGKSSITGYLQALAEKQYQLHPIYTPLGGAEMIEDLAQKVLEATLRSGALIPQRAEKLTHWLAKYIGEQSLFGFTIRADALQQDAPSIASGMLPFLNEVYARLRDTGITGIFLALDEINGITRNPKFAHFIKGLVDANALANPPLPLLLVLCGVQDRRREMIEHHEPIERIFDVVEIDPLRPNEVSDFFNRAFSSVNLRIEDDALKSMVHYSAGFPKIMHLVGDAAYWRDMDGVVDYQDAIDAVYMAADEVGKKFVDQQVFTNQYIV
ncbi:MAG: hypothetical protein JW828_14135 [Sedimentisphaerales bacterium]|nr:hypothetical protein [Sedimentisphaerales bacterium]